MKYRKDIHDYMTSVDPYWSKDIFKPFDNGNGVIFSRDEDSFNSWKFYNDNDIKRETLERFDIRFAEDSDGIICKCGRDKFKAFYGNYELILVCWHCKNTFTAYSG